MADEIDAIVVPEAPADEAFAEEQPAPEPEPFQPRSVYDRIREAQRLIAEENFVKDKKVELRGGGGYSIIPIAQILDAVRRAHARAGIVTVFGRPEYDAEAGEFRKSGTPSYALGHVDVKIIGDGPGDMLEVRVPCEAQDTSDKLTNKLLTNAMRCLYRTLYSIDASEDPEDENRELPPPMSRAEKAEAAKADPFFGKGKADDKPARQLAEDVEAWGADRRFASSIKAYKSKNSAMSAYDLPEGELRKLHDLLVSKGAGQ